MVNVSEALDVDKILEYYIFDNAVQQTIILADLFESYDNILMLGESGIMNLVKGFYDRTVAAGKFSFSLRWTNFLKETIHWTQ